MVARPDRAELRTATAPKRCGGCTAAGLRARLSANHVGGGGVSFKFMIASSSESLRSFVFGPLALRRVGSLLHGVPGRARVGLAWSDCLVPPSQSGQDNVHRASRHLGSSRARRAASRSSR